MRALPSTVAEREVVADDQGPVAGSLDITLDGIGALCHGRLESGPAVVAVRRAAAAMGNNPRQYRHDEPSFAARPRTLDRTTSSTGTLARPCRGFGEWAPWRITVMTAVVSSATG